MRPFCQPFHTQIDMIELSPYLNVLKFSVFIRTLDLVNVS